MLYEYLTNLLFNAILRAMLRIALRYFWSVFQRMKTDDFKLKARIKNKFDFLFFLWHKQFKFFRKLCERYQIMTLAPVFQNIRSAINQAPRNGYIAELHLQIIKYADVLQNVSGKEFCEEIGIGPSFGTEFLKMKKIATRLKNAGLDPDKI